MLRRKLDESGWTLQVRKQCECTLSGYHGHKITLKDEVKVSGNLSSLSPQDIVDRVGPNARSTRLFACVVLSMTCRQYPHICAE